MIYVPNETGAALGYLVKQFLIAVLVAVLVAWVDWGGVDRTTSDRALAGIFAFMSANALTVALSTRPRWTHPSHIASQFCGAVASACFAGAMLTEGLVAIGFAVPGLVCLAAEFSNLRTWKRALRDGSASLGRRSVSTGAIR